MSIQLYVSILSPLLALVMGRRNRSTVLWFYPLAGLIFDVTISFLKREMHIDGSGLGNLFFLLELILVSLVYYRSLTGRVYLVWFIVAVLGVGFIVHTLWIGSAFHINKEGASLFSLAYIYYSMWGFYSLLKKQEIVQLERSWFFWINTAFLIYGCGSFFIFLLREYAVHSDPKAYRKLWNNIFLIINIIKYLLIGIALRFYKRK